MSNYRHLIIQKWTRSKKNQVFAKKVPDDKQAFWSGDDPYNLLSVKNNN